MIKLFNKWDTAGASVEDSGLRGYINTTPYLVPRSCGKNASNRFWKSKYNAVERLANKLMNPGHKGKKHKLSSGHCCGGWARAYKTVERAFMIIEHRLKKNPFEVFVKALENSAPREEVTSIEYGGARYPQAVDCSPQRRVDIALRMMTQGAFAKTFHNKLKIEECLAEELIKAYNFDNGSSAIAKKLELERQADASR